MITIEYCMKKISNLFEEQDTLVYRGQTNANWKWRSAATRRMINRWGEDIIHHHDFPEQFVSYHREILIEPARTRGFGVEQGRALSDMQILAKLQHFGAATGLLDFTWNPLVALWFACQDTEHDGKLLIADTSNPIHIARIPTDESVQNVDNIFLRAENTPKVLYWEPMLDGDVFSRILRQRSVFLVGRPCIPEPSTIPTFREILIPSQAKQQLLNELKLIDISYETLFQDVFGFAEMNRQSGPFVLKTSADSLRRGNHLYQQAMFAEAVRAYSRFLAHDPESATARFLLANSLAANGQHLEAISEYDSIASHEELKLVTPEISVYFNRGNSKSILGDCNGAIDDFTTAINLDHTYWQAYYNRGNAYSDSGQYENAVADYDRILDRNEFIIMYNRGNALFASGNFADAMKSYQDALSIVESQPNALNNLAHVKLILTTIASYEYSIKYSNKHKRIYLDIVDSQGVPGEPYIPYILLLAGRAGNVGNFGGPSSFGGSGLSGGPGLVGSNPTMIQIRYGSVS